MNRFYLFIAAISFCMLECCAADAPKPASIRRLDGTTITVMEAESFARKTLEAAHVTGAQIAVLDGAIATRT